MNLPINTTSDGTAFAVTVSMPNNAQLCNIINGGGALPANGGVCGVSTVRTHARRQFSPTTTRQAQAI